MIAVVAAALVAAANTAPGGAGASHDQTPLRVSILRHQFDVVVSSEAGLTVRPPDSNAGSPYVAPEIATALDIRPSDGGLLLAGAIHAGPTLDVAAPGSATLAVNGQGYRGSVIVQAMGDGSVDVINVVDLEQYLYGVVGSEMEPSWPAAALQAQAIVARTYAVAHLGTREWLGYDLAAGEMDQAYKGMQAETPAVVAAVDATGGTVLVYGADLVHAYYSDCDGGYTSDGNALADPQPYLTAKPDGFCALSPEDRWAADVPLDAFSSAFAARYPEVGAVEAVDAGDVDASGRLTSVIVRGTLGSRSIAATEFRSLAGNHLVRSTRIAAIGVRGDVIHVEGAGFGHGVGMSQWGARTMAADGRSAKEILTFYYPGAAYAQIANLIAP